MEAATAPVTEDTPTPEAVPPEAEVTTPVETSDAEERDAEELFRFSDWVHVGPAAENCEDAENGTCSNPMHFHAWVRLPNQFQHQAIREKALAAKARRQRQFRDEESDISTILDNELEEVIALGEEDAKTTFVEELVHKDFMRDFMEVQQELLEDDEWATIDEDRQRLDVLEQMSPDERPHDEYDELMGHVSKFTEIAEDKVREEKQQPLRLGLQERSLDELRKMVRDQRVEKDAQSVYMQTYTIWEQYIGTLRPRDPAKGHPVDRIFGSVEHLKAAAPEVIRALDGAFTKLDGELGRTFRASLGKGR